MSVFDPTSFLDAQTTQESKKRPPLPAGREFVGIIGELKPRQWQSDKGGTHKEGIAFDVPVTIDLTAYPDLGEKYKDTPQIVLMDSIMLDTTEGGAIDYSPGKNGKLRRYRESTNLNVAGQPFAPRMLTGRQVKVKISHRTYEGELYDQIDSVAKAA